LSSTGFAPRTNAWCCRWTSGGSTRAIHERQRHAQTLEGLLGREEQQRIATVHQNAQRLLRPLLVANPFAKQLSFLDHQTRARRDFPKYLTLIRRGARLRYRKGRRKRSLPASASHPEGLYVWTRRYLEWLRVRNYSARTVGNREKYLELFIEWCEARSVTRPVEVTKPILEGYQRHLFHLRRENGRPLSFRAQAARLVAVRAYFKWLTRQNVLLGNPASELEMPRLERRLPKHVLTLGEAEAVLAEPDVTEPLGLRDRAMLETLFSTGMRRSELVGLTVYDVDAARGTVLVRGKGQRERMIPIGERALAWIGRYLDRVRPGLVVPPDSGVLFLTRFGEGFHPEPLTHLVRRYVDQAELGKSGACRLFRHTMATLMLEGGADIRYIQEMLGHAELGTTQIYTQVSILSSRRCTRRRIRRRRAKWSAMASRAAVIATRSSSLLS
jgi:integrase/recombinase XerD